MLGRSLFGANFVFRRNCSHIILIRGNCENRSQSLLASLLTCVFLLAFGIGRAGEKSRVENLNRK